MKTELFNIFSARQKIAIKDAIIHGLWGNIDHCFNGDNENVNTYGYCTGDIYKGGHFTAREISGVCSGISKIINRNKLDFINYDPDYWGDNSGGMIFINLEKIDATLEELKTWAKE